MKYYNIDNCVLFFMLTLQYYANAEADVFEFWVTFSAVFYVFGEKNLQISMNKFRGKKQQTQSFLSSHCCTCRGHSENERQTSSRTAVMLYSFFTVLEEESVVESKTWSLSQQLMLVHNRTDRWLNETCPSVSYQMKKHCALPRSQ